MELQLLNSNNSTFKQNRIIFKQNNSKGSITIYIIIVLFALLFLSATLFDVLRMRTAQNEVSVATDMAITSALSHYDKNLHDLFGIYAVQNTINDKITKTIESVFRKNLYASDNATTAGYFEFLPYKSIQISTTLEKSLNIPQNLILQIIDYSRINSSANISKATLPYLIDFHSSNENASQILEALSLTFQNGITSEFSPLYNQPSDPPIQPLPQNPTPKDPRINAKTLWQSFLSKNTVPQAFGSFTDTTVDHQTLPSVQNAVYNSLTDVIAPQFLTTASYIDVNFYKSISKYFEPIKTISTTNGSTLSSEILVSEYIMSTFKNQFTDKTPGLYDLNGNLLTLRPSYYANMADCEYILHGHFNSSENLKLVKQQILFLRFMQNLTSFCSDPIKISHTKSLARNISSATHENPDIVASQILLIWVLSESKIDVEIICNNISLPANKSPQNWMIQPNETRCLADAITTEAAKDPKTPAPNVIQTSGTKINYNDCLKLFAIVSSIDKISIRTADLIQIIYQKSTYNPTFLLSNTFTTLCATSKVQIPFLFSSKQTKEIFITNQHRIN